MEIPKVNYAIIGGSSTFSINFPEDLKRDDVKIISDELIYNTPFGISPVFKLIQIENKKILSVRMHGWRPNEDVTRGEASQQLFWVLKEAGVKKIYAEGGVGSINHLLNLRDLIIVDDYIDYSMRQDIGLGDPYLLTMREPICPTGAKLLIDSAKKSVESDGRHVFNKGIYVNTDGRHFESRAEVQMFRTWYADVVGQSITPEVYLAREIGACYAGIYMVVNYAEGIIKDWEHKELSDIFYQESFTVGNIIMDAIKGLNPSQENCNCREYRNETLLKEK